MPETYTTDRELNALKPAKPGRRYIAWDAGQPSLGVRVTDRLREDPDKKMRPHRAFVVVRRRPGDRQPVYHVIGRYPEMKLAAARAKAKEVVGVLASGKHPADAEEERRREEARKRKDTFASVAEEFIKRHVLRLRSARATEALIRRELLGEKLVNGEWVPDSGRKSQGHWRDRPVTEIARRDAVELLEGIADRGSRHQARKTLAAVSKLFNWALHRDTYGLDGSPLDRVRSADLFGAFEPRSRVLIDDELRLAWRGAKKLGYPFGTLVRALMLTGQRLREISGARWSEVDLNQATLTVPAERMKGKIAHTVPITPAVGALLAGVPRFEGGEFVFTTTAGKRPVSGFSKAKARLDREIERTRAAKMRLERRRGLRPTMAKKASTFTFHDIRRTVRTRLSGLGVLPLVAELVIGHKQAGVQAVYDLHRYDDEKRSALLRWERSLMEIVEPPTPPPRNMLAPDEVDRPRKGRQRS